jgi:hypothetical protein
MNSEKRELDYADARIAPVRLRDRRAALTALVAAIGAAGVSGAYFYLGRERPLPSLPPDREPIAKAPPATQPQGESAEQIYRRSIVPLLDQFDQRNDAAVNRAMIVLHDRMSMHHGGVGPFTKDIASWHTRFGVLRRYPSDLWRKARHQPGEAASVAQYVNGKFRSQIVSEEGLKIDVQAVLANYNDDMLASRNLLYAELSLPLERIKTAAPVTTPSFDEFREEVDRRAGEMTRSLAPDTVISGLAAVAGGWVATDVAQLVTTRIVTQVLTQMGTEMAAEGIEAGGATVGGAAAGGGGGSVAGPIGTIIGVGVGLVVGAIVDWRLSKQFETKVAVQCNGFLDTVEQRLRDGTAQSPGLLQVLRDTTKVTSRAQREAIEAALKEPRK